MAASMPRVLRVDPSAPDASVIDEAARVLRAGGLVAFPTETVYGLGARALDPVALARVFAAKGRPVAHPLIAHVLDEEGARRFAASWPEAASRMARAFWPGPLTLIVERVAHVPRELTGGGDSVAVRAPSHPIARALLAALGEPIAAPSANRYQAISPTAADHVVASLGGAVDLVLDGGPCERGIESTVVDARTSPPRVLRPGPVTLAQLRAVDPTIAGGAVIARAGEARPSPGMDARHYAPRARLVVAASCADAHVTAERLTAGGARVGLVVRGGAEGPRVRSLPAEPEGYARAFFAALHDLDVEGVDAIVVEAVPDDDAWSGVADRIRRGSA